MQHTNDVAASAVESAVETAVDTAAQAAAQAAAQDAGETSARPERRTGSPLLEPLRQRDFRLVFSGESISLLGDQFHFVALAWLVLQLTGSGLALGTVLMTAAVPRAVFMLVGGALSDRISPRNLMLISNALRAVVVAVIATLVLTGNAQLWQLFIAAAIFGIVDAFFYPAMTTIVPMLVAERLLPPANALIQGIQQLAGLIGPALAGIVVAAVQTGPAFAIDAVSFAVAAGALVLVRGGRRSVPHGESVEPAGGLLATIGEGIAYVWRDPAFRSLMILTAAFNFAFTGPISVGLPYLANTRFEGGSAAFGLLLSAFGAGALAGAVLAGSIRHVPRLGSVTLAIAMGLGVLLATLGIAPNVPAALGIGAAMGIGVGFINVRTVAWMQARAPKQMLGRVMSLLIFGSHALAPISLALAGVIIDLGAVTVMYAVAGGIIVVATVLGIAAGVPARMTDQVPA